MDDSRYPKFSLGKYRLYKKNLKTKTLESKQKYINYKYKLTSLIRNGEKKYYTDRFETLKGNIRDTWKLINKVIHDRQGFEHSSTIPSLSVNY